MRKLLLLFPLLAATAPAQCTCPCYPQAAPLSPVVLDSIANFNVYGSMLGNQQRAATVAQTRAATENMNAQTELLRQQTEALRQQSSSQPPVLHVAPGAASPQGAVTGAAVTAEQTEMERLTAAFKLRVARARQRHPDFDAVTSRQDVPITPAMWRAVLESDSGAEVVYYFGKHAEEAQTIAKLSPVSSILEIGRIAATLSPAN